jgi:quinol monooxygenase YgiN
VIHVLATIELNPGTRDEFLSHFRQIVPLVLRETGCLEYGPTVDLATEIPVQLPVRDDVVTVVEKWASLADLQAHLAAPHMVQYRQRVASLLCSTSIQVLAPV